MVSCRAQRRVILMYGLHPWRLIDESQLILVRDSGYLSQNVQ
jgi:hypothetical protein